VRDQRSRSGATGEAQIRTMRMTKAGARASFGDRFVSGRKVFVSAARSKRPGSPAEMLLQRSPVEQRAYGLRALSSSFTRGDNEETRHRAGQIAELKAGGANKIHHDDRPSGQILSQSPGCNHN